MRRIITTQPTGCRSPYGIARRGVSIPLADYGFLVRLQFHGANDEPIGLYKDEACTDPALDEFDVVAAIRDDLSGGGRIFKIADPDKRPFLIIDGGRRVIETDGLDDCLTLDGLAISPTWIAAKVQYIFAGGLGRVTSTAGGGNGGFIAQFGNWNARYGGSNISLGTPTAGYDALFIQGGTGTSRVGFNGSNTPQTDDLISGGAYSIGDYQAGGGQVIAMRLSSIFFGSAAIDAAAQTVLESYTATLSP